MGYCGAMDEAAEAPRWDVSPAEAAQIQRRLRGRLVSRDEPPDLPSRVRIVAGVDNAYVRQPDGGTLGIGVAVALSFPALESLAWSVATAAVRFPYVPGLLAFREVPVMLAALAGLGAAYALLIVDAHGYAHPRRFGAASHLGVLLDRPTIGCAKSRLVGAAVPPAAAAACPSRRAWPTAAPRRKPPACGPTWAEIHTRCRTEVLYLTYDVARLAAGGRSGD